MIDGVIYWWKIACNAVSFWGAFTTSALVFWRPKQQLSVPSIRLVSVYYVSLVWYLPCSETLCSTVEVSPSKPGVSWSAEWCRCVLVQFGHSLALHVAVSPPVPVRILPWSCHTLSGEDATSFLCAVWLFFPKKTEFFVWYFEFNAFFRHLKKSRDKFCTDPFLCACTYVRVLCVVFCLLSICVITRLYCTVHAYSAFPIPGSGVAKLGHTGARALATGSCAPPVQVLLKIIGAECTVINRKLDAKSAQKCRNRAA